jgi:hypothetical protein
MYVYLLCQYLPFLFIVLIFTFLFIISNSIISILIFDKHTQSHISTCLKSTFSLIDILKIIFGNVQSQFFF